MITRLTVAGYKSLRDVSLPLGSFTVLVGPNDAGKSSLLEALEILGRSVHHPLFAGGSAIGEPLVGSPSVAPTGARAPLRALESTDALFEDDRALEVVHGGEGPLQVSIGVEGKTSGSFRYRWTVGHDDQRQSVLLDEQLKVGRQELIGYTHPKFNIRHKGDSWHTMADRSRSAMNFLVSRGFRDLDAYCREIAVSPILRWDPLELARPAPLALEGGMRANGFGLASELDRIRDQIPTRDWLAFESTLEDELGLLAGIRFRQRPVWYEGVERDGKNLEIVPIGGARPVPASQASHGTLLALAYLSLAYQPDPPALLLIEEPERGLNPQRMGRIIDSLRACTRTRSGGRAPQILLTTHSPALLHHVRPEEVRIVSRNAQGHTQVEKPKKGTAIRELSRLWLGGAFDPREP